MGKGVEDELRGEDTRECDVEAVKQAPNLGEGPVVGEQLAVELGLRGVDDEVLQGARASRGRSIRVRLGLGGKGRTENMVRV